MVLVGGRTARAVHAEIQETEGTEPMTIYDWALWTLLGGQTVVSAALLVWMVNNEHNEENDNR